MRAEAGFPAPDDLPARTRYFQADDSPLTPSQIEVVGDEADQEKSRWGKFQSAGATG
jgi:hypothetical protein